MSYISEMPRLLSNLICTLLFVATMCAIGYALKQTSADFALGCGVGMMAATSLLWLCNKLGMRIF